MNINVREGKITAGDVKIAIVAARFNDFVVEHLVEGAVDALVRHEVKEENIFLAKVPGVPVMFGVLTTENIEQAVERSGSKAGNKGAECAVGALEMINLLKKM